MRICLFVYLVVLCTGLLTAGDVENGLQPKGKAVTLQFTEDLRFGSDEEEDVYFWEVDGTNFDVTRDGHFVVADIKDKRVLEFDKNGGFLRVVADKGNGPGELPVLSTVQVMDDGSLLVLCTGNRQPSRFRVFDKDFKYVSEWGPQGFSTILRSAWQSGDHYASTFVENRRDTGEMITRTGVLNKELKPVMTFSEKTQKLQFNKLREPGYLLSFMTKLMQNSFGPSGMMCFDKDGNFYHAVSTKYEITRLSPDLKTTTRVIRRKHKPIVMTEDHLAAQVETLVQVFRRMPGIGESITDAFLEKIVKEAEPPQVKPPLFALIPMENGYLLAVHDWNSATGVQTADIFNQKGEFVGQSTMDQWAFLNPVKQARMFFKNGFAYTVETDGDGDNRIVRYRYELVSK